MGQHYHMRNYYSHTVVVTQDYLIAPERLPVVSSI